MTKQALINNPIITRDVLDYLKAVCDIPAKRSDSDEVLRWKAAQRDIYLQAEAQYTKSMSRDNTSSNVAENLGIKVRNED